MRNFKGIIMSMYSFKLTILRHFLKTLSMIHICPLNPLQVLAATLALFYVRNEHFKSKYTPKLEYLVSFSQKSFRQIYMPPKPLAIDHWAALAIIHR